MERYSKESSSKWQSKYSEEFKQFVCNEFLTGTVTRREIEHKYNIGNCRLTYWLRDLGYDYLAPSIVSLPGMKKQVRQSADESATQLKRELQEARLLVEAYRKMIEIAEHEFKIKIVKKSNSK
ncbi:hypothetical protein QT991_27855 [Microcoleus sp. S36a_D3]|jgi:transposase-like protein|uniref:hypothetical protein n=1 Tax=Flavobacterium sp. FlaQc-47 TaxID=3374180 RepID=UPI002FD65BBD